MRAAAVVMLAGVALAAAPGVGVLASTSTARAQTDPIADAEQAIAAAETEADRAADQYFEALAKFESLNVEISRAEEQLDDLRARAARLRAQVEERALHAYIRSGDTDIEFGFAQEEQAFAAARRTELLERLNASDADAAAELHRVTDALQTKRAQLEAERAAQEEALAGLRAEQETIEAKLAEAQALRQSLVAAAAAAAAAAAETTPAVGTASAPAGAAPPAPARAPSAPTPPANYTPTGGEHPQHNHPFLVCTRRIESGGNYQAYNPAGPYLGAYQFLQSTWNSTANHAGRGELVGLDPRNASEYDQDDMAWTLYNWQGKAPWGGRC